MDLATFAETSIDVGKAVSFSLRKPCVMVKHSQQKLTVLVAMKAAYMREQICAIVAKSAMAADLATRHASHIRVGGHQPTMLLLLNFSFTDLRMSPPNKNSNRATM